jgi:excisionase family DNA binding protein
VSETYLTVQEIAQKYRVSKMTVYRLIHSGELTAVRIGTSYRVLLSSWKDYLSRAIGT